jgi:hypothetical protein
MSTQYQVNISMPDETVTYLVDNNFSLYGFQVVQSSASVKPVAWFHTRDFALNTTISWEVSYQAYVSRSAILPNQKIVAGASYPVEPGQVLTISNPMGIGEVGQGDPTRMPANGIGFLNKTNAQFTCGIQQQQPGGGFGPICAFELLANKMDVVVPTGQIYLMFSSTPIEIGSVVEQAYGPGLLLDLARSGTQSVSYQIAKDTPGARTPDSALMPDAQPHSGSTLPNTGWSWGDNASWAQSDAPNQSLVPLLVQPLATLGPQ